ncbi:hypothetical protein, conserved [Babesia ovata]|uniref:Extracellular matrix-binding ebh n=1 Tax=Babesia ovata TaxID=189622 RepID=A0A2H6K892_9APIC|nr:uncharacterized protein BOVATA_007040 [Babesia ovata]GBE59211.1 hypothetical protein, conserved [Babesia ovata]
MAPKALTDCPENLRESIDWLIQVRHGNGEKGLTNLAEAVKKLIEGAIENATSSLKERKEQLECSGKSWESDSHCHTLKEAIEKEKESGNEDKISKAQSKYNDHYNDVHYLTEDARGKALDDIDARRISLGQLAGQLSGFIGGSGEIQKAILNGLQSNVNQLEKLLNKSCGGEGCDCDKYPEKFSEGLKKLSAELEKEIKQIEENKDHRIIFDGFQTHVNAVNGKIHEKHSAIEKTIKPLEASKKEYEQKKESFPEKDSKSLQSHNASKESLKTLNQLCQYAESLKTHKSGDCENILNNFCSGLETFLGFNSDSKGYSGTGIVYSDLDRLCDGVMAFLLGVLESVQSDDAVTKYDGYFDPENQRLNKLLQTLKSSIGQGSGALFNGVDKVSEWLGRYEGEVKGKTQNVTSQLGEIELWRNEDYDDVSKPSGKLDNWIKSLSRPLEKSQEAVKALKYVDNELRSNLDPHVKLMHNAVGAFYVNAILGVNDLHATCSSISGGINSIQGAVIAEALQQGDECVRRLTNEFETRIQKPMDHVKRKLEAAQETLAKWIGKAQEVVGKAIIKCDAILGKLEKDGSSATERKAVEQAAEALQRKADELREKAFKAKEEVNRLVSQALGAVKEMDEKLKEDLYRVKKAVGDKVTGIRDKIGELYKAVKEGKRSGVVSEGDKKIAKVIGDIQGNVAAIKGDSGSTGLAGIVSGVNMYAMKFAKNTFENSVLNGWSCRWDSHDVC